MPSSKSTPVVGVRKRNQGLTGQKARGGASRVAATTVTERPLLIGRGLVVKAKKGSPFVC